MKIYSDQKKRESKTHQKYRVFLFLNISLGILDFNVLENCIATMCKENK